MEDQLKVYYPFGGKRFLLHWYTYNERGHILIANNENQLEQMSDSLFKKHIDTEIKSCLEIDIVAPPKLLCSLDKAYNLKRKIDTFHQEIIWRLKEVIAAGKKLPALFSICKNYETDIEDDEDDDSAKTWRQETYYQCKNCKDTIRCDMIKSELYDKYSSTHYLLFPIKEHVNKLLVLSRAPIAKDDDELYYASSRSFSHHGSGVTIEKIDLTEHYYGLTGNALFFFKKIKDIDTKNLQDKLNEYKKQKDEHMKLEELDRVKKRTQEEIDRQEKFLSIFN